MSYFIYHNKKCWYEEAGSGQPLLFLHGNTASSRMFAETEKLYRGKFKTILIDFLGHGRSDRLDTFQTDLWFDEAQQVIAFLDQTGYKNVNLIGSSGGAQVAINVALERPDLVNKVIADSFEGEVPLKAFVENVIEDREASKQDEGTKSFYIFNHGEGWEQVVDNDTKAIHDHYIGIGKFFHKSLSELQAEILLTGSREDEFASPQFYEEVYQGLVKKIGHGKIKLFEKGGHPALLSNGQEFYETACSFLEQESV